MKLKKATEKIMNTVFLVCGFTAVAAVGLITIYMIISGHSGNWSNRFLIWNRVGFYGSGA